MSQTDKPLDRYTIEWSGKHNRTGRVYDHSDSAFKFHWHRVDYIYYVHGMSKSERDVHEAIVHNMNVMDELSKLKNPTKARMLELQQQIKPIIWPKRR